MARRQMSLTALAPQGAHICLRRSAPGRGRRAAPGEGSRVHEHRNPSSQPSPKGRGSGPSFGKENCLNHAAISPPQRHDQGGAPRRPQPQARPRRNRKSSGVAEGTGQLRQPGGSPRRGDAVRGPRQGAPGLRLYRRRRRLARRATTRPTPGSSIRSTAPPTSCTAFRNLRSQSGFSGRERSLPGSSTIPPMTSSTPPNAARARFSTTSAFVSRAGASSTNA